MRRDDNGLLRGHLLDHLTDRELLIRVQAVRRLVHDQHLGIVNDRLRETGALTVTLRQRLNRLLCDGTETRLLDHGLDLLLRKLAVKTADLGNELQVVFDNHRPIARSRLGQIADGGLRRDGIGGDVVSADHRRTARRRQEARDHAHGRRLAGAVRTEEAEHFALLDGEGNALHRLEGTEAFLQVLYFEHGVIPFLNVRDYTKSQLTYC